MTDPKIFTGRKAFLWFAGFFLVIFSVNGFMLYLALGSWGGLSTNDAYRKGLYYNDQIAAAKAQRESGWDISLVHSPKAITGERLDVKISWPENDLPPAKVTAQLSRAVTNRYDQEVTLTKTGSNIYTAPVTLPVAGQWNLTILVKHAEGPLYRLDEKIFVSERK